MWYIIVPLLHYNVYIHTAGMCFCFNVVFKYFSLTCYEGYVVA
jgi:hypothetical protein